MPYIKQGLRKLIKQESEFSDECIIVMENIDCAGDLNYAFTVLAKDYISRKGLNYQNINDVIGALEGAKAEFQRRTVAPYEDTKIIENGDIE